MTIEYCIMELRRHENEINELITHLAEAYQDYEKSKEYYSEHNRWYIESYFKDLKGISSRLHSDAEKIDAIDKQIKGS